jgi:hypothetical protein
MNRLVVCLPTVLLISYISICSVGAAVFERDWQSPGDGLLTYDDVHRREWLDLSVSRLSQFPEPRFENAIAEIASGGLFEGFTWAKSRAVRQLAVSGGIDISTTDVAINGVPTDAMIDLLGPTAEFLPNRRSIGFINEAQTVHPGVPPYDGAAFIKQGFAGVFFHLPDDLLRFTSNGLMLYRPVPEPGSISLLALAIYACLITLRERRTARHVIQ